MARREFWEIVKDDEAKTFEVLGKSVDDTPLINLTCKMQKAGMPVRSETIELTTARQDIPRGYEHIGYEEEFGLMDRLKRELEQKKQP
jgi:hypothetical protein